MKIAILGYGKQSISAFEYWNKPGNQITICDSRNDIELPEGVDSQLGLGYLADLEKFDLIVRGAPIIHPREIRDANPDHPEIFEKITSATNEFFKVCSSKNIIGITGTKGKGTTSTLIAKFLQAAGYRVHLGGNIGISPLELLKDNIKPDDWVVLELANFQLIDFVHRPAIGVCLMIAPEHLDWHESMVEYIQSKQQLFRNQTKSDTVVFNAANLYSEEIADVSPGVRVPYEVPLVDQEPEHTEGAYVDGGHIYFQNQKICNTNDMVLLGRHNLENVCAAIAATWQLLNAKSSEPKKVIKSVLQSFSGLPHRLEIVKKINDVWYVNDSFGTTPETAMVAIQSFKQPKILILGGSDKGVNYDELGRLVASSNARHVILIGYVGPQIGNSIKKFDQSNKIKTSYFDTSSNMEQIVQEAQKQAKPGDVVLLSTGCASFDMFKNYEERGKAFKASVENLAKNIKKS